MNKIEIKKDNWKYRATLLNSNTQKAQNFLYNYLNAKYDDVEKFYNNPSTYKVQAQSKIMAYMYHLDGWGYRVCGGNSSMFTAGWLVKFNDKTYLIYETAFNTYAIEYNGGLNG